MNLKKEMIALAPKLRAYAWVLSRGAPDADELVEETLRRAWEGRRSLAPGASLKGWMFRILRTVYLASLAGGLLTARPARPAEAHDEVLGPDPEWRASFGELLEVLADLPDQDCEALLLVAGAGLSYQQAADVCYCSISSVKGRVSRARERLAEIVERRPCALGLVGETMNHADVRLRN